MYEEFFGLTKRPFPAVPLAEDFVSLPAIQECLDSLLQCVARSRGIAVMTAGTGMGKTLLAKRLGSQLRTHRTVVYLGSAGYQTRQDLLQALLFELDVEYIGLPEQEARLRLTEVARRLAAHGRPLLVIIDEAHNLNTRLFDELRGFVDASAEGVPLMNLVLCGQFELEEILADPALSAFSQRIGAQVVLPQLTREESARFLSERLLACGAERVEDVLTADAMQTICRASDGNLRCLTQLADHSLLLAFGISRKPIDSLLVRDALQDLKELPLHWNDVGELDFEEPEAAPEDNPIALAGDVSESLPVEVPTMDRDLSEVPYASVEVGAGLDETGVFELVEPLMAWDEPSQHGFAEASPAPATLVSPVSELPSGWTESPVIDRYALLDRVRELPPEKQQAVDFTTLEISQSKVTAESDDCLTGDSEPEDILHTVRQIHEEILIAVGQSRHIVEERMVPVSRPPAPFSDVVLPPSAASSASEACSQLESGPALSLRADGVVVPPQSRFHDLFTRLSRRRQQHVENSPRNPG